MTNPASAATRSGESGATRELPLGRGRAADQDGSDGRRRQHSLDRDVPGGVSLAFVSTATGRRSLRRLNRNRLGVGLWLSLDVLLGSFGIRIRFGGQFRLGLNLA